MDGFSRTRRLFKRSGFLTRPTLARQDASLSHARPQRVKGRVVPSGAHGATNKEHQSRARRRVSEAAGSSLRV